MTTPRHKSNTSIYSVQTGAGRQLKETDICHGGLSKKVTITKQNTRKSHLAILFLFIHHHKLISLLLNICGSV